MRLPTGTAACWRQKRTDSCSRYRCARAAVPSCLPSKFLAPDRQAGAFAVPGVRCNAFGPQDMLFDLGGRRLRQFLDDADIARDHVVSHARLKMPDDVLWLDG